MIYVRKLVCWIRQYHVEKFFAITPSGSVDVAGKGSEPIYARTACCGCGQTVAPGTGLWRRRD